MNNSEKHIIENAIQNVSEDRATEEQKILTELYYAYSLRKSLNNVYEKITPINTKEKDIIKIFQNFEDTVKTLYDLLYDYCGSSQTYTIDNIIEYTQDLLSEKIKIEKSRNKNMIRKLFKVVTCRKYMEKDKWYNISDIIEIIKNNDADGFQFYRQNLALIMTDLVERGYFTEKSRKVFAGSSGMRYFMKTDKKFI